MEIRVNDGYILRYDKESCGKDVWKIVEAGVDRFDA